MVTKPQPNLLAHKREEAAKSRNITIATSDVLTNTTMTAVVPDEEYILRWNDHGVSFFTLAEDLLQQELLTDVTIWCGDRVFDAHRLVLCACSPLFRAMLTRTGTRLRPDQPIVFLKDVSAVHFERLLQFMYCGEVRVPNGELEALLASATSLSVRGLANAHERTNKEPLLPQSQPPPPPPPPEPPVICEPPPKKAKEPAPPPKKRRLSTDASVKKSPLSPLDNNQSHFVKYVSDSYLPDRGDVIVPSLRGN
jgi:hypothetical protein